MVWLGPDVGSFDEMVEAAAEKEREFENIRRFPLPAKHPSGTSSELGQSSALALLPKLCLLSI